MYIKQLFLRRRQNSLCLYSKGLCLNFVMIISFMISGLSQADESVDLTQVEQRIVTLCGQEHPMSRLLRATKDGIRIMTDSSTITLQWDQLTDESKNLLGYERIVSQEIKKQEIATENEIRKAQEAQDFIEQIKRKLSSVDGLDSPMVLKDSLIAYTKRWQFTKDTMEILLGKPDSVSEGEIRGSGYIIMNFGSRMRSIQDGTRHVEIPDFDKAMFFTYKNRYAKDQWGNRVDLIIYFYKDNMRLAGFSDREGKLIIP